MKTATYKYTQKHYTISQNILDGWGLGLDLQALSCTWSSPTQPVVRRTLSWETKDVTQSAQSDVL